MKDLLLPYFLDHPDFDALHWLTLSTALTFLIWVEMYNLAYPLSGDPTTDNVA